MVALKLVVTKQSLETVVPQLMGVLLCATGRRDKETDQIHTNRAGARDAGL